jgi:hypothetical protein
VSDPRDTDAELAAAKRQLIRDWQRHTRLAWFVETGSGDGATINDVAGVFVHVVSIEIGVDNYMLCHRRFLRVPQVTLIHGDSNVVLPDILDVIQGPAIFWLDAHYCGSHRGPVDTPVLDELVHIFHREQPNVILIDDARKFGADPAYPTVQAIEALVHSHGHDAYRCYVELDVIHLVHDAWPEPAWRQGSGGPAGSA